MEKLKPITFPDGATSDRPPDDDAPTDSPYWPPPGDPMAVARRYIETASLMYADGVPVLRWWRGAFYEWASTHWVELADPTVKAPLYKALEHVKYRVVTKTGFKLVGWEPTRRKIGDLLEAIQSIVLIPERDEPPAWLQGGGPEAPVAFRNGLLDLDSRTLHELTPRLFNLHALPYDYDGDAPKPERWLTFLKELWPDDDESIRLLRQWFGLVITDDTSYQKILLLVGPPRSGKGTILRVLKALLGAHNVAGPTMASLGEHFGLWPLVGKPLATISDARLHGDGTSVVVERLLSISGEDTLTIDMKYRTLYELREGDQVIEDRALGTLPDALVEFAIRLEERGEGDAGPGESEGS